MFTRITLRFAIAVLLAMLFTPLAPKLDAQDQSQRQDRFVAHEWGTFTSVSTADGKVQRWNPLGGPSELPSFVYQNSGRCSKAFSDTLALVRM
jgi:hypothetical protein